MPPRTRWLLLWIALAAVVVVRAGDRKPHRGVILDHLEFGRRLLAGEDLYADWKSSLTSEPAPLHAPYPPSFGLLTAPFAVVDATLGLTAARVAWALLQVLAIAMLFLAMWRMPMPPPFMSERERRWIALCVLLLLSRLVLRDTHGGGGNLINVAMCALAFADAERGKEARAGWWLGFSLATKPTQAFLLPLFLLHGRKKTVGHALLCGASCVGLSVLLLRGEVAPWLRWLEGSLALARQTDAFAVPALQFPDFEWMNQSLRCATARWIGEVPPEFAQRVAWGVMPGLGLSVSAAAWTARAILIAMLAWMCRAAWNARRGIVDGDTAAAGERRTRHFAAALVFSLLASPLSWKAHHVALVPAFCVLCLQAARTRSRAMCALLGAWFVCCGIGQAIVGDDGDEWLNSLYVMPAFDVLLFAALLRRRDDLPK